MTSQSNKENYSENPESHQDDDDLLKDWVPDPNAEEVTIEEIIKALDYEPVPLHARPNALLSGGGSVVAASSGSSSAPAPTVVAAPAPGTRATEVARSPETVASTDRDDVLAAAMEKSQTQHDVSDDSPDTPPRSKEPGGLLNSLQLDDQHQAPAKGDRDDFTSFFCEEPERELGPADRALLAALDDDPAETAELQPAPGLPPQRQPEPSAPRHAELSVDDEQEVTPAEADQVRCEHTWLPAREVVAPNATLDASLAPGCYGISLCFKEGSAECSTCPFAPTCGPLAKEQSILLAGRESFKDIVRKQAKIRKRKQRDREAAAAVSELSVTLNAGPGPQPSRSKAMLTALQEAIANRRPSDRFLQNLTRNQKEYVIVAIIAWSAPKLSAREIAEIYTTKTRLPMNKKQAENRLARVAELVKRGIWKPFNLVRDHGQPGAAQPR